MSRSPRRPTPGLDVIVVDHHVGEPALPRARRGDQSQPARRDERAWHARRGRRRLPARRRASTARCARPAGMRDAAGARSAAVARSRGARHDLRCGAADRHQPRAGGAGPQGDAQARQSRAGGARRCRRRRRAARRLSRRLHPGAAGQCRRPRRRGRSRRAAACRPTTRSRRARSAQRLDALNAERREIEARVLGAGDRRRSSAERRSRPLVFAAGEGWHPGVIGIVAEPAEGALRPPGLRRRRRRTASARAPAARSPGVALGPAVIAARQAGLLINGGGHAMAAGFTVAADEARRACAISWPSALGAALRRPSGAGARARHRRRAERRRAATPDLVGAARAPWRPSAPAMPSRASPSRSARAARRCRSASAICAASSATARGTARLKAIAFRCARRRAGAGAAERPGPQLSRRRPSPRRPLARPRRGAAPDRRRRARGRVAPMRRHLCTVSCLIGYLLLVAPAHASPSDDLYNAQFAKEAVAEITAMSFAELSAFADYLAACAPSLVNAIRELFASART